MSCLRLRLFWPEYFETTTSSIYLNNRARLNKIDITIYYVYVGEVYRQNASRDELYWPERQYLIVWHRICVYVSFPPLSLFLLFIYRTSFMVFSSSRSLSSSNKYEYVSNENALHVCTYAIPNKNKTKTKNSKNECMRNIPETIFIRLALY